ncbi:hypothetical protein QYM36_007319 [Artemia franciscana]|uniref:Uncharacterized protein n=1 Tax=Artemia franciscana TaxID=6661 RepID=A0AA88HVR2_ARTSF|nr:hypothetical protein QYM36_007319 [Artemia franciscana]
MGSNCEIRYHQLRLKEQALVLAFGNKRFKSALIDSIRMLIAIDSRPMNVTLRPEAKQAVLLDFMAFIRTQILSKTETFEKFACRMLRNITKELTDLTELHVISDKYDGLHLIKDQEGYPILLKNSSGCHSRRGECTIRTFVFSRSVILENAELMLRQSSTKVKIAKVIFEIWKNQTEDTPFPLVLAGGFSDRREVYVKDPKVVVKVNEEFTKELEMEEPLRQ